jgi:hypothetical protein
VVAIARVNGRMTRMDRIVERYTETTPTQDSVEATVPGLQDAVLRLRQAFPSLSKNAIRAALGLPETGPSSISPKIDGPRHKVDK